MSAPSGDHWSLEHLPGSAAASTWTFELRPGPFNPLLECFHLSKRHLRRQSSHQVEGYILGSWVESHISVQLGLEGTERLLSQDQPQRAALITTTHGMMCLNLFHSKGSRVCP